jgi:predicted peptidase
MRHLLISPSNVAAMILLLANGVAMGGEQAAERGFVERAYKDADGKEHKYVVFVPHSYKEEKPYPLILFLHGAGEREGGPKKPVEVGIGSAIKKYGEKDFPFFVIFPQASARPDGKPKPGSIGRIWSSTEPDGKKALGMLEDVRKQYKIDEKRLYLTGLSMGGFGTWTLAFELPDKWAAIVPICGGGDPKAVDKIKHIPCWCFHGDQDKAVPVERSRTMIDALKAAGAQPRYDEYPGVGHNSWDQAYGNRELYDWLLKQNLK